MRKVVARRYVTQSLTVGFPGSFLTGRQRAVCQDGPVTFGKLLIAGGTGSGCSIGVNAGLVRIALSGDRNDVVVLVCILLEDRSDDVFREPLTAVCIYAITNTGFVWGNSCGLRTFEHWVTAIPVENLSGQDFGQADIRVGRSELRVSNDLGGGAVADFHDQAMARKM
mgnify:CR=1 FL=1